MNIQLKSLVKEISMPGGEVSSNNPSNEKIMDEIIKTLTNIRTQYPSIIAAHPEGAEEFRMFLEDIARVFDRYGIK
jgi:hypothetical protein